MTLSTPELVDTDETPICPHCRAELNEVLRTERGVIEKHIFYFCPACKKVLGVGYNLGN